MILFTVLALTVALLLAFIVMTVSIFGASIIVIFGDLIVCIAIIGWIMKKIINKKRNK